MATNGTRGQPTAANRWQDALSQQSWAAHDAILIAIRSLEGALTTAAADGEPRLSQQLAGMLNGVAVALAEHVASTENPDGLFADIDDTWPTMAYHIERLRREHSELLQKTRALALRVEYGVKYEMPCFQDFRLRAALLLTELRHHRGAESDLIHESFFVELGVGD